MCSVMLNCQNVLKGISKLVNLTLVWALQWRHNERDGITNHQPYDCLLYRSIRRRWKISKLRVTDLLAENSPVTGEFPHKRTVTRKMFPFDDVIMEWTILASYSDRWTSVWNYDQWYYKCWNNTFGYFGFLTQQCINNAMSRPSC